MAVTSVVRLARSKATITDSTKVVWFYQVMVDDLTTSYADVLAAVDPTSSLAVPQKGSVYTAADGRTYQVNSVDAQQNEENPNCWDLSVDQTQIFGWGGIGGGRTKSKVTISGRGAEYTEDLYQDLDDEPMTNSAGQPFDPTVVKTYYDVVFCVKYRTSTLDSDIDDLRGMVNTDDISLTISRLNFTRVWPAGTLKLTNADYETTVTTDDDGSSDVFFDVQIELTYRKDGWLRRIIDQGYYELVGGELENIKDANDDPINAPVLLDGNGAQLGVGEDAVFLTRRVDDEAPLAPLLSGIE